MNPDGGGCVNLRIQKLKALPKTDPLLPQWQEDLAKLEPVAVLNWAQVRFARRLVLATSLGQEDQVLTDMLAQVDPEVRIVTLDTGRLFTETYELIERTERRYGIRIELFSPDSSEVESMVRQHGVNLFRQSVDLRKLCCSIRKLHPLERALQGSEAWICGLRREQSVTRQEIQVIETAFQSQYNPVKTFVIYQYVGACSDGKKIHLICFNQFQEIL